MVPSGKQPQNYGKITHVLWVNQWSMAIFNSKLLVYQRVDHLNHPTQAATCCCESATATKTCASRSSFDEWEGGLRWRHDWLWWIVIAAYIYICMDITLYYIKSNIIKWISYYIIYIILLDIDGYELGTKCKLLKPRRLTVIIAASQEGKGTLVTKVSCRMRSWKAMVSG